MFQPPDNDDPRDDAQKLEDEFKWLKDENAKLKDLDWQEPVYMYRRLGSENWVYCGCEQFEELSEYRLFDTCKLHTASVPQVDAHKLQKEVETLRKQVSPEMVDAYQAQQERIAELERKLAEQQVIICALSPAVGETRNTCEELNTLLAKAREPLERKLAEHQAIFEKQRRLIWDCHKEQTSNGSMYTLEKFQEYYNNLGDFGGVLELTNLLTKAREEVHAHYAQVEWDRCGELAKAREEGRKEAVPNGLVNTLEEAASVLEAVATMQYTPQLLRLPLVDELHGFAAMLTAAPKPEVKP